MNDTERLVEALRCFTTPRHVCKEGCPYRLEIAVGYEVPFSDFEKDGVQYIVECDISKMCKDAADYIESANKAMLRAYESLISVKEELERIKKEVNHAD